MGGGESDRSPYFSTSLYNLYNTLKILGRGINLGGGGVRSEESQLPPSDKKVPVCVHRHTCTCIYPCAAIVMVNMTLLRQFLSLLTDVLPHSFHTPFYFTKAELQLLQGSPTLGKASVYPNTLPLRSVCCIMKACFYFNPAGIFSL